MMTMAPPSSPVPVKCTSVTTHAIQSTETQHVSSECHFRSASVFSNQYPVQHNTRPNWSVTSNIAGTIIVSAGGCRILANYTFNVSYHHCVRVRDDVPSRSARSSVPIHTLSMNIGCWSRFSTQHIRKLRTHRMLLLLWARITNKEITTEEESLSSNNHTQLILPDDNNDGTNILLRKAKNEDSPCCKLNQYDCTDLKFVHRIVPCGYNSIPQLFTDAFMNE